MSHFSTPPPPVKIREGVGEISGSINEASGYVAENWIKTGLEQN